MDVKAVLRIAYSNKNLRVLSSLEEESLLTPEQAGIGHMTKQMVENHTCLAGFYYRYSYTDQT